MLSKKEESYIDECYFCRIKCFFTYKKHLFSRKQEYRMNRFHL